MLKKIHLPELTPGLRYADITCRMLNYIDCQHIELPVTKPVNPKKSNWVWGVDYMLMDSKRFMGVNGSEYENVINMFEKIWDVQSNQIINDVRFAV
jgi:hypothetical protein